MANDATPASSAEGQSGYGFIRNLVSIFTPLTVLSALLYYFGVIRERAFWGFFGVDLGSVGFQPTDYLVRSPGTVFVPLVILSGSALIILVLHHLFSIWIDRANRRRAQICAGILGLVAGALLTTGAVALTTEVLYRPVFSAIALGTGAGMVEYIIVIAVSTRLIPRGARRSLSQKPVRYTRRTLLVALIVAGLFAATADIAQQSGENAANVFAQSLSLETRVVVFSKLRLQLAGTGLSAISLDPVNAAYAYRYNGLRLMLHNDDRWLLIPAGWTDTGDDTVMILKDSEDVRVELAR